MDGKQLSAAVLEELKAQVHALAAEGERPPHLAAILVGNSGASETYVASKIRHCALIGYQSSLYRFEDSVSEADLLQQIKEINRNPEIDGLIVQLPLPKHIDPDKVNLAIDPKKDVDGFHPENFGRVAKGLGGFAAATPLGIQLMLERAGIDTFGKHCVVVGRSQIVGMPMAILLQRNAHMGNGTVTICHRYTENLAHYTRQADILIVAIGIPYYIKGDMVKEGAIVVDVGITRVDDATKKAGFRLAGDVDFDSVAEKASWLTPVPGGVGLMTICGLLANTMKARMTSVESRR